MRIIGGTLGGRRFNPPAKEALYNILHGRLDFSETKFLDLFGGTGSHSLEMVSRGCTDATYIDSFKPCCEFVRKISKELGIDELIKVICIDAFRYCAQKPGPFDFIFAGPPYGLKGLDTIPDVIFSNGMLAEDGLLVLEHNPNHDFTKADHFKEMRKYGETHFSFFSLERR